MSLRHDTSLGMSGAVGKSICARSSEVFGVAAAALCCRGTKRGREGFAFFAVSFAAFLVGVIAPFVAVSVFFAAGFASTCFLVCVLRGVDADWRWRRTERVGWLSPPDLFCASVGMIVSIAITAVMTGSRYFVFKLRIFPIVDVFSLVYYNLESLRQCALYSIGSHGFHTGYVEAFSP